MSRECAPKVELLMSQPFSLVVIQSTGMYAGVMLRVWFGTTGDNRLEGSGPRGLVAGVQSCWRYLEGARWDANANCLEDADGSRRLFPSFSLTRLPLYRFKLRRANASSCLYATGILRYP